jgi:SAM-dependent methyltransferase
MGKGGLAARYDLVRCPTCDFRRVWPEPASETIEKAYRDDFHASPQQSINSRPLRRNALRRAHMLRRMKASGNLLDVGCGTGIFVEIASEFYEAWGIDLSPEAAASGRARGLRLMGADFSSFPAEADFFDVITLWDVLSSLPDPDGAVRRLAGLLKPGGLLALTYPAVDSVSFKLLGEHWPFLIPPVNICYYTETALSRLTSRHGLIIKKSSRPCKWVDMNFLVYKFLQVLSINIRRPVKASRFQLPVNLLDIREVVYEKKA